MRVDRKLEGAAANLLRQQLLVEDGGVPAFYATAFSDPTSIPGLIVFNSGGYLNPGAADTRAAHAAEIGASGAITNARGLAGMYAALAMRRQSHRFLDQDTLTLGYTSNVSGSWVPRSIG